NYNAGVRYVIDRIDRMELFCGTHNANSCILIAEQMQERGLANNDPRIYISQLYGMGDFLSCNLSNAGYNLTKYLPYAPVDKVLPYLIRRAEENTSVAGQTGRELELIRSEVKRRKNKR
ncbi:proline dehydrogenase family protein, partial [Porphyromonas levii]|uniref:proline dehydrogenase family protein n=1 Tax=Porphyromonas levii TaxID=28114 RepID=UPI001BA6DF93